MARYLRRHGWHVLTPELRPSNGSAPLEQLAAQLATFIDAHTDRSERLDLVGFSMGGLVCRYYLQRLGGAARVDRFVSIASPNNGTRIARLLAGAGMRQMRPRSAFLENLNSDPESLCSVACTVILTPLDFIILPSASSRVPFATTHRVRVFSHVLMLYHPAVFRKLTQILGRD